MATNVLKGIVYSKYKSCTELAKTLGWTGRKTRDIVSGRQMLTAKDISELSKALGIADNPDEMIRIFFSKSSQNVV